MECVSCQVGKAWAVGGMAVRTAGSRLGGVGGFRAIYSAALILAMIERASSAALFKEVILLHTSIRPAVKSHFPGFNSSDFCKELTWVDEEPLRELPHTLMTHLYSSKGAEISGNLLTGATR